MPRPLLLTLLVLLVVLLASCGPRRSGFAPGDTPLTVTPGTTIDLSDPTYTVPPAAPEEPVASAATGDSTGMQPLPPLDTSGLGGVHTDAHAESDEAHADTVTEPDTQLDAEPATEPDAVAEQPTSETPDEADTTGDEPATEEAGAEATPEAPATEAAAPEVADEEPAVQEPVTEEPLTGPSDAVADPEDTETPATDTEEPATTAQPAAVPPTQVTVLTASPPATETTEATDDAASNEPATDDPATEDAAADDAPTEEAAELEEAEAADETPDLLAQAESEFAWEELGESTYAAQCAACHQPTGQGVPGAFPPLAGHMPELYNAEGGRAYLIHVVLHGLQGPIEVNGTTYNGVMPPFGQLGDEQVAATLNHELTSWGNEADLVDFSPITPDEVAALRAEQLTPQQVLDLRP